MILPFLAILGVIPVVQAQNIPLVATVSIPKSVHAGSTVKAAVKLHFAEGLHGYQNPPSDQFQIPVTVKLVSGAKLVSISYPKGTSMAMAGSPPMKVYSGDVTVNVVLKAPKKSGPVVFSVDYQQCNEASCFPPSKLTVKGSLSVSN